MKIIDVDSIIEAGTGPICRRLVGKVFFMTMGGPVQTESIVWIGKTKVRESVKKICGEFTKLGECGDIIESQTLLEGIQKIIDECDSVAEQNGGTRLGKLRKGASLPVIVTSHQDPSLSKLGASIMVI